LAEKDKTQSLFQVAVLHRGDKGETTEVVPPRSILAKSADIARLKLVREIPEAYSDKLDECEVIVRPF